MNLKEALAVFAIDETNLNLMQALDPEYLATAGIVVSQALLALDKVRRDRFDDVKLLRNLILELNRNRLYPNGDSQWEFVRRADLDQLFNTMALLWGKPAILPQPLLGSNPN